MPIQLKVADTSYQEQLVTLNGNTLFITITYNSSDERWYLDLVDRNELDLLSGVKILPKANLTKKYLSTHALLGGDIYCADIKGNGADITRDNFGTDKQFQLWYVNNTEQVSLGL